MLRSEMLEAEIERLREQIACLHEAMADRDRAIAKLKAQKTTLRWLAERALAIRHPSTKWTKAETARSWKAWEDEAKITLDRTAARTASGGQEVGKVRCPNCEGNGVLIDDDGRARPCEECNCEGEVSK